MAVTLDPALPAYSAGMIFRVIRSGDADATAARSGVEAADGIGMGRAAAGEDMQYGYERLSSEGVERVGWPMTRLSAIREVMESCCLARLR